MLTVRCKNCNKEISSHPTQSRSCGCPNMTVVVGDNITARDLSKGCGDKNHHIIKSTKIDYRLQICNGKNKDEKERCVN